MIMTGLVVALVLALIVCGGAIRLVYVLFQDRERSAQHQQALERAIWRAGWGKQYEAAQRDARSESPQDAPTIDWDSLRVGDYLIALRDDFIKPQSPNASVYPGGRQFSAGKAYPIMQIRESTGVVFCMDDGGLRRALNAFQGRHFVARRNPVPVI